jgi:hypothetical protein
VVRQYAAVRPVDADISRWLVDQIARRGEQPNSDLKHVEKWLGVANPNASAISVIGMARLAISASASASLNRCR